MASAKMLNLERVKARLARMPQAMLAAVAVQLAKEVQDLADAIKAAAPVDSDLQQTPGQLRDSVHYYANPDRPLSYRIIADAKDEKGEFIGPHVEHGHKARDGSHVPRVAFFFPVYRARKKGLKRRINAAGRKAAKAIFEGS